MAIVKLERVWLDGAIETKPGELPSNLTVGKHGVESLAWDGCCVRVGIGGTVRMVYGSRVRWMDARAEVVSEADKTPEVAAKPKKPRGRPRKTPEKKAAEAIGES
jgi:hypothetical protein